MKAHYISKYPGLKYFDRIVLVIRNPLDAYKAEYKREQTGGKQIAILTSFNNACKSLYP